MTKSIKLDQYISPIALCPTQSKTNFNADQMRLVKVKLKACVL